jgi:hypothetical protein
MIAPFNPVTRNKRQQSHLLRWTLTLALIIYFGPASDGVSNDYAELESKSVLDLQRLVDQMLVAHEDHSANVLDLQEVLLVAVQPEPTPGDEQPAPQDDAVLPPHSRFLLPATLPPVRSIEIVLADNSTADAAPQGEEIPPAPRTFMRYQYHLLSNAPPLSPMYPVV